MASYGIVVRMNEGGFFFEAMEILQNQGPEALFNHLKEYEVGDDKELYLADYRYGSSRNLATPLERIEQYFKAVSYAGSDTNILRQGQYTILYSTYFDFLTLFKKVDIELDKIEGAD